MLEYFIQKLYILSEMDPLWLAMSKLRRGKLDECVTICDEALAKNQNDQAAWFVKCRAVIKQNYIDDIELDEEGIAEVLMDENAMSSMPRPGTSLQSQQLSNNYSNSGSFDSSMRPVSQSGRPLTGFARPSTNSRPLSGSANIRDALQSSRRSGTARPMTTLGRELRLGTASLASSGTLVDVGKLNIKKYATRQGFAVILTEYLLYVEHNVSKALELCAEATAACDFKDWFWKARLGKCYFKLGMYREAEKQFRSSLKIQPIVSTYLELANVYIRLDMPNSAMDLLIEASEKFTTDARLVLGVARIYDSLSDPEKSVQEYKKVLSLDASNVEALASLGAHFFYTDQPELSIRYYRRLLQMGIQNAELWNNLGLCCFYSSQYDLALSCLDRALAVASDDNMADVWYNIGHIGVALGDLSLAYQAFKVAASVDPNHGEALNNIAVLEMRRQKFDLSRACLNASVESSPQLFEPMFNSALMAYRLGDFQDAYNYIKKSLVMNPGHGDSKELLVILQKIFSTM